jgi:uncharacterized metal-binding protein
MADEATSKKPACACEAAPRLIFACAGASDTAEITFRAAKRLSKCGAGRMYCLAGIGGGVQDVIDTTAGAESILAIDGCDVDCAKLTLERAGFNNFKHLRVTDLGLQKGSAPPTMERIVQVARAGAELMGLRPEIVQGEAQ